MSRLDHRIAELAGNRDGVLSRDELREIGARRGEIAGRVERGTLHRIHRGVYAVGHKALGRRAYRRAALLASGPDAVLCGPSGAAQSRLSVADRGPVHVMLPRRVRAQRGIRAHSGQIDDDDRIFCDGLPVLCAPRLLLDLTSHVGARQLARLVAEASDRGVLDTERLTMVLQRFGGHRGIAAFREATAGYCSAPTRSPYEAMFLAIWSRTDLPRPAVNVPIGNREVDFFWPQAQLIVEIDGFSAHRGRDSFESDRRRAIDLRAAGFEYLAFTPRQLERDSRWVLQAVTTALRKRVEPSAT